MQRNQNHFETAQPEENITTVRVPENEAIKVIGNGSSVIIFGDGRIKIESQLPIDMLSNKLTVRSTSMPAETHSS